MKANDQELLKETEELAVPFFPFILDAYGTNIYFLQMEEGDDWKRDPWSVMKRLRPRNKERLGNLSEQSD